MERCTIHACQDCTNDILCFTHEVNERIIDRFIEAKLISIETAYKLKRAIQKRAESWTNVEVTS